MPIATSSIVSQAFRMLEVTPPSSLSDDTEKAAAAQEQYPLALRMSLEAADWSFASTLAYLPLAALPATAAADPDLPFLYRLPGDLIRLHEVGDFDTMWRVDAIGGIRHLRADQPAPLRVRYTADVVNEAVLPATFQTAVSAQLALLLGPRWQPITSKLELISAQHARAMTEARRQDARQASQARYDGLSDQGDWAKEARR